MAKPKQEDLAKTLDRQAVLRNQLVKALDSYTKFCAKSNYKEIREAMEDEIKEIRTELTSIHKQVTKGK